MRGVGGSLSVRSADLLQAPYYRGCAGGRGSDASNMQLLVAARNPILASLSAWFPFLTSAQAASTGRPTFGCIHMYIILQRAFGGRWNPSVASREPKAATPVRFAPSWRALLVGAMQHARLSDHGLDGACRGW